MSEPLQGLFAFFQKSTVHCRFPIYIFVFLCIASVIVALYNFVRDSEQRTVQNVYMWLARLFVGVLAQLQFQQTLWKLPPTFTDNPGGSSGLRYWMGEMVTYAAFKPHASLVSGLILPTSISSRFRCGPGGIVFSASLIFFCRKSLPKQQSLK